MLFFIKRSKLFSVNEGPQRTGAPYWEVRSGLDPALPCCIVIVHFARHNKAIFATTHYTSSINIREVNWTFR